MRLTVLMMRMMMMLGMWRRMMWVQMKLKAKESIFYMVDKRISKKGLVDMSYVTQREMVDTNLCKFNAIKPAEQSPCSCKL